MPGLTELSRVALLSKIKNLSARVHQLEHELQDVYNMLAEVTGEITEPEIKKIAEDINSRLNIMLVPEDTADIDPANILGKFKNGVFTSEILDPFTTASITRILSSAKYDTYLKGSYSVLAKPRGNDPEYNYDISYTEKDGYRKVALVLVSRNDRHRNLAFDVGVFNSATEEDKAVRNEIIRLIKTIKLPSSPIDTTTLTIYASNDFFTEDGRQNLVKMLNETEKQVS